MDFSFHNRTTLRRYGRPFFQKIAKKTLETVSLPLPWPGFSINLVSSQTMRLFNQHYRHLSVSTDVLSFPLSDAKKNRHAIMELGDIFLCPGFIRQQAKREKKHFKQQLTLLTIHGLLHLLGYDHEQSHQAAQTMFALQEKVKRKLR